MHHFRLVTLVLIGATNLCALGLRLGQTQSAGLRRITNTSEEAININPSISGDGRIVTFESTEDIAGVGGSDHFRAIRANIAVDPATFVQMGGTRSVTPAVSQDGSRIAFASKDDPLGNNPDGNSEIFLFDGTRLTQVTNTSPGSLANRVTNGNFQPSISDDGRFIAFSSNRDLAAQNSDGNLEIFIYDSVGGSFSQITNSSGIVGFTDAKISGNGALVAYIRDNGTTSSTARDLIEQPRFGGAVTVLAGSVPSLAVTYGRAISDDGTRVVYSSQTGPNTTQVFLYDGRGGASVRQVTSLGARVTEVSLHPSISGDGSRISFATRRNVNGGNSDGGVELYLFDLPTATFSRITNAPSAATAEVISSLNDDGSIVAFSFPRVLSGAVTNADLANDSEIYTTGTPARPPFGSLIILNGASLGNEPATTEAVAPDSIAVARGGLLANTTQQSARLPNGTFPTNVGGTTVTVNGRSAQIFFVSPTQVNFLVPPQTELGTADVIVTNSEGFPSRGSVATLRSAPGIFTKTGDGTGEALALNSDTLQEAPFDPSDGKVRLTIFATGARNTTQLSVTIGGQVITPEMVLAVPDMPGLDEIHLRVPASLKGAGVVNVTAQGDGRESNPASTRFTGGDILINEVLADPPGAAATDLIGDANHDGVRSSSDDEFVELVNSTSRDIDISGYQLLTRSSGAAGDTLRHTFAAGTIVPARTAVVIFGGGSPNPADPAFGGALILKASTGGLSLSNTAGIVTLRDSAGAIANIFEYGGATGLSGGSNQSLTRSPDITGAFTGHATADGAGGRLFSPGTRVDGTPFQTIPIARIDVTPVSPTIDAGAKQQFTAKAFDSANQEVTGVIFFWQSSNTSVATIDQTGLATSLNAGTTQITASGRGVQSAPDTLTVRAVQRVLTRVDVTPNPATIPVSGAQQFTAKGFDQFGNEITGLTFTWESSATSVATVDQNGLATGVSPGQSTIKATTQSVSGSAVLNVTPPTLIINEVLADPPTGAEGDANHDATRDGAQDEFVELVNSTNAAMNISGWTLRTHSTTSSTETVRHTFAAGSSVPAGEAIVVFGGGTFDPANPLFGCSRVVETSTAGLSLTNGGLTILIRDGSGNLVTEFSYGGSTGLNGGNAQSLTRSPDITGSFVLHTTPAAATGRRFSAGVKLDGTPFGNCPGHPASVTISPTSTSANVGESTSFTAQAFDQFGRAMIGVPITFASDNTAVATIDSTTPNPMTGVFTASVGAHNPGVAHITATANDGTTSATSSQATLTVNGPALSINDVSVNEGNAGTTTFTFTISLSQPAAAGGVNFDIATQDGTGTTANNDYVARSLTNQTIAAGAVTYSFDVTVNGDATIEPNETFVVNVTNVSGASITKGQGAGTILNDDSPTLTINDVSANEGNSGATTFTFTVSSTLPAPPGGITFDIATANGTATTANGDYVARSLTGQTIPAGQSSYSFDVIVNGDTLVEPNETFFVNISNVSANASIGDSQGLGTIQNDDTPVIVISQLYGGGGNSGATFKNDFIEIYNRGTTTVDLAGWSVQYTSATGTGTWSVTPLCPTGSCLIQPGRYFLVQEDQGSAGTQDLPTPDAIGTIAMTTGAGKVAVSSSATALSGGCPSSANVLDIVGYGSTASCFEGSGPAAAPGNATADFRKAGGCVDTNDNANDFFVAQPNPRNSASPVGDCKPEITINDVTVTENNSGTINATFTVNLVATSAQTITVDFATADGTATTPADYQTQNGTLTFNPGDLTKTITVLVNGDTLDEASETFFVNLSNASNAVILDNQGQGTITDNDPAPSLSINDVSVAEGDSGTSALTLTVSLSTASGQTVTVSYATADNTATAGSDYQSTSGTLTFNSSETSKTISVTVNGDTTFEQNESVFVNLSGATNASISDNQGIGTITNDDAAPPVPIFSITDVTVTEGNSGSSTATFDVTLSMAGSNVVTVDYAAADGTATVAGSDYQSANGTLTFAIGETSKQINVTINGDTLVESDETFTVNLTNPTGGAIIGDNLGIGTIQNDDTANLVISQVYPGGGLSGATFTNDFIEIFNRGTTTVDFSVTPYSVQFLSTSASTWAKTDLTSGTVVLLPGRYFLVRETSGGANGAALPTPDATGTINLTSTTAGKVALVSGTTLLTGNCPGDDGTQPFNPLSANVADFVGYGGTAATANHCYEGSGPALFTLSNNTIADFRKAGGCTDTNDNAPDFFASTPSPRNSSSPANNCTGGITPNLTINDVSVTEGNSGTVTATFTVSLSAAPQGTDVTFDIATADSSATTANSDYVAKSLTNQIIPAGQTTYTFTVTVNGDTAVEPDETFFVNVANVSGANVTDGQGIGTIQNDDLPTLSINDVSAAEGDAGTTTFTFNVTLSAAAPANVTFDVATADGTTDPATAGSDYVAIVGGSSSIVQGSMSTTVSVTVNGDTVIEPHETFFVNITNVSGATVLDGQGLGTIQNDDSPLLSIDDVSMAEGDAGTTTFTFTVSSTRSAPAGGITFTVNTQDGTAQDDNPATEDNDYVPIVAGSGTILTGNTSTTINVTVNGDKLVEPDETFNVVISSASGGGATIGDGTSVGTILNDDTANLVISQTYPGGGLSGATFTHDYIELFNQGATTVDFSVTPYSVQFLSTTGSTWAKTDLTTGTIAPGRYFLISGTSGGGVGAALPTPDATGSLNLTSSSPSAGKVALVVGTTLLVGNCPGDDSSAPFNPVEGTVVDFVGYAGTSITANHCYEGAGPAPFTFGNNTIADFRKFGGCQDTTDNATDFLASTPIPRNTSSPVNDCTAADLEITKTDSPDPVIVGSNVTYTINVTNHGPANATSVLVTDNLPANVTFVSCASTGAGVCAGSTNNRSISYASLAAGGSETMTLVATANGPAGTQITNTATVSSSTTDPTPGNNSATATTDVNNPTFADLSISKSDSIDPVAPGNTLTYTISLTNNGPDTAQSVVVTDNLPADVTFVDCSSNQGGVCGGPASAPTVSFASLANGATATITIRVTVSSSLSTGAVLSNTASVTASSVDSVSSNDSETETTNVQAVNAGDILFSEVRFHGSAGASDDFVELYNPTTRAIDISGFKVFRSNGSGTQTLHVTINSNVILSAGCHYLLTNTAYDDGVPGDQTYGTSITDDGGVAVTLPSGTASTGILDQVGLSSGSAYKEGTPLTALTTNVDRSYERKPGGSFGNGTDTNDNSADFFLNPSSSNPQNSSSGCLNTASADLFITKTDSPDPVTIGSNITYTITVLNNGAATAQNVLVTDNLPSEVTYSSCLATGGAICGGSGNNRSITLTSLPSGSSFTATIVATANGPHGTTVSNTASVSSATIDANSSNDSATATTLMQEPTPGLSIDDVTLTEGTGGTTNFVFTVTLTPSSSQTVTVNYATSSISPATAVAGTDYTSTSGMLTFTPSDTSEQITVQVTGDSANEAICETFFVKLSSAVNASISDDTGQGGITDDDGTKLVISQVYGGGGNGGATYTHDFIEIFNRGNTTVSLTGWSVQYAAAAGTIWSVTNLSGSIAPGKYYLIQENSGGAAGVALPTPDATGTITMAAGAGKVALVSSTTALTSACPSSSSFIDLIGYGTTANCFEGSGVAPTPSATLSDQRAAAGCTDVGNNATDFAAATPAARNSAYPANTCSCSTSYSSFFSFGNEWLKGSLARVIDRNRAFPNP